MRIYFSPACLLEEIRVPRTCVRRLEVARNRPVDYLESSRIDLASITGDMKRIATLRTDIYFIAMDVRY